MVLLVYALLDSIFLEQAALHVKKVVWHVQVLPHVSFVLMDIIYRVEYVRLACQTVDLAQVLQLVENVNLDISLMGKIAYSFQASSKD